VTILVRSYGGADCPANPPTPYTLLLDEPLGNRKLPQGTLTISWSNEVPGLAWDVQVGDYLPSNDTSTRIRWTRYGRPIDDSIISSLAGAGHCGRQRAVELSLSPADGFPAPLSDPRTYIRDPDGAVSEDLRTLFDPDATLPPDAVDTGYRAGPLQLWLAPSDLDEAAYVVIADDVERWPRSERSLGCY